MSSVEYLRKIGFKRISLKTGAYGMEALAMAIRYSADARLDLLTIDGAGGGTGMSPWNMMEHWGVPSLALHAKALVIDDDRVFVGSANLDPRSLRLNTEMGLLVTSPELNADIRTAIEPDFSTLNAWRLQFDDKGGIVWMSEDGVPTVQPATSFMQRIEDWFLSTLPIEAEL